MEWRIHGDGLHAHVVGLAPCTMGGFGVGAWEGRGEGRGLSGGRARGGQSAERRLLGCGRPGEKTCDVTMPFPVAFSLFPFSFS